MTIKKLQTGFRIRASIFVPVDSSDPTSVRGAAEYAEALKELPDAPVGTVVEDFSFRHGQHKSVEGGRD